MVSRQVVSEGIKTITNKINKKVIGALCDGTFLYDHASV